MPSSRGPRQELCVCVCVCTYVCMCIYTFSHICIYTYSYIHIYNCVCVCVQSSESWLSGVGQHTLTNSNVYTFFFCGHGGRPCYPVVTHPGHLNTSVNVRYTTTYFKAYRHIRAHTNTYFSISAAAFGHFGISRISIAGFVPKKSS